MFSQHEALLKLLGDHDAQTVALVKEQLALGGSSAVPQLLELKEKGRYPATRHLSEVIARIEASGAREMMETICNCYPENDGITGLERAVLVLSQAVEPGCDVENTVRQLNHWGAGLRDALDKTVTAGERVAAVTKFFGKTLGLRGNTENYYSLKNSLLTDVVRTRLGIPLSLALVYLFVGRRAALDIAGVCFPGHFLVRVEGAFLDPFEAGKLLTPSDCADILMRQKLRAEVSYFEAAGMEQIFRRLLANLLYVSQSDHKELVPMLERWVNTMDRHLSKENKPPM